MKLRIRAGTRRDVPTILALIRGLADYEKLSHEVEATAARLRQHGFGRRRYFETLLCFDGKTPVGFALYFFTYSTFLARPTLYLEDLFVTPDLRGRGAGKTLLSSLARIARQKGCGRRDRDPLLVRSGEQARVDEVVAGVFRGHPPIEQGAARTRHVNAIAIRAGTAGFFRRLAAIAVLREKSLDLWKYAHAAPSLLMRKLQDGRHCQRPPRCRCLHGGPGVKGSGARARRRRRST
jgi:GNAT superfamily N-acetyltransferase